MAARLAGNPQIELHLLPGRVRSTTQAAVGPETVSALANLRVDLLFLGTNGLTADHGLTTPDWDEAATKRAMVETARRVVVLADASKIGTESSQRFASLDQVDVLVTDDSVADDDRKQLEGAGLEVVVA